ncbi:MAG: hypothetical protein HY812_09465 [Planctomycetes bacterium]|nr:hypothetical protein [Planctomycetota bacterium]
MFAAWKPFTLACAVLFAAASPCWGGCPGDPGFTLVIDPPQVPVGTSFEVSLTAPNSSFVLLLLSSEGGPTPTQFGTLCVGPSLAAVVPIFMSMPDESFLHFVPCDPKYPGIFGHMQYLAVDKSDPSLVRVSNSATLNIVANSCGQGGFLPGDLVTFTQGRWGEDCATGMVGCLRDAHFAPVFPAGLVLGDPDGPDSDLFFAALLTASQAVEDFLPAAGLPAVLDQDQVNPLATSAGAFAGELAAAKLNAGFDLAGIFDPLKGLPQVKIAGLVFVANVHPLIRGLSVAEVIYLSDLVISGELNAPVDLDGNGSGDATVQDLEAALRAFNENFADGLVNQGSLGLP